MTQKKAGDSRFIKGVVRQAELETSRKPKSRKFTTGRVVNLSRFDSPVIRRIKAAIENDTFEMPLAGARANVREPKKELAAFRNEVLEKLKDADALNLNKKADPDKKIAANVSAANACTQGLQALCDHHFRRGGLPSELVIEDTHLYESCIRGFHKCHTAARSILGSYIRIGGSAAMKQQHELVISTVKKNHSDALIRLKKYIKEDQIPKAG